MENILKSAKFGDLYLTRDKRQAVFVGTFLDDCSKKWWKFVISGENEIRFYNEYAKSGLLDKTDGDFPNDIIEKYKMFD